MNEYRLTHDDITPWGDVNETRDLYGDGIGNWSVTAWRRPPNHPEWSVTVKYGDGGWECDPGVYGETLDYAIAEVEGAKAHIEAMLLALRNFQKEQKSWHDCEQ